MHSFLITGNEENGDPGTITSSIFFIVLVVDETGWKQKTQYITTFILTDYAGVAMPLGFWNIIKLCIQIKVSFT